MTRTTLKLIGLALAACVGTSLAIPVLAQPGPGAGDCPKMQQGQGRMGHGHGMRGQKGGGPGATLMTAEERDAFRGQMREVKTLDECKTLQAEHRTALEIRAKEQGITLPTPRRDRCEMMKARGFIQ
ncbi:MAG: hypothetical protein IPO35_02750 [Uliginosibacterium sp.]|nr:hypothetical protein [Uliginosibacterium sp.]MBK9614467.1 hypothetical protein [Uliginosibacterium sp.]